MTASENTSQIQPESGGPIVAIITALWIIVVSFMAQIGGWFAEQMVIISGGDWPWWTWAVISVGQAVSLLIPLLLLSWRWRGAQYQTIFRLWTMATIFLLFLIPVRVFPLPTAHRHVLPQILMTVLFGVVVVGWRIRGAFKLKNQPPPQPSPLQGEGVRGEGETHRIAPSLFSTIPALLIAPFLAYPWLAWGAIGSPLDAALDLISGLLLGLIAGLLIDSFFPQPSDQSGSYGFGSFVMDGFMIGIVMLILASGLSVNGMQLLLMIALAALGWLLASVRHIGGQSRVHAIWLPLVIVGGIAAAAPMMLIDPDELFLVLSLGSGGEILGWAMRAVGVAVLIAWVIGFSTWLAHRWLSTPQGQVMAGVAAVGAWAIGFGLYTTVGQPGFHGDHLFVILKDQADVSAAANIDAIDAIDARRRFVYDTLVNHAILSQAQLRADLDRANVEYRPYYLVNAIDVTNGPLTRIWLESHPAVDRVLLNPILRPLPATMPTASGSAEAPLEPAWNLTMIGADRVWREFGVRGEGVVIGQSDSGAAWRHPELLATYRGGEGDHDFHWLDPWFGTQEPTDFGGHGTHTLGSIVGQTTGVAPGAEWYACANLQRNLANPALYLDCMQFMLAPHLQNGDPFTDGNPALSADVLNNSWGCPDLEGCDAEALVAGVQALRHAGIFVVVSAGNDGPNCETVHTPLALYDDVFSVGAVDVAGNMAMFSSRGPVTVDGSGRVKPDIVAPGVNVLSAFPNGTYEHNSGTSMAGPHVAGVVALIWSANPDLIGQIDETEAIIRETAQPFPLDIEPTDLSGETVTESLFDQTPLDACGDMANTVGHGLIDAYAAVKKALE